MPTKALQKTSDKEVRIATAVAALTDREQYAYRHFVNSGQKEISEDKADELFKLYQQGKTTLEIQRLFPVYSHAQVVHARVHFGWDERKDVEVKNIQTEVPAKVETALLETQEFLANLLRATTKKFNDAVMRYIATGDAKLLEEAGVPVPSTLKEMAALMDMYMKISGTDSKKVDIRVQGQVAHKHQQMKPEDAEKFMDDLLGDDKPVQDAEFEEVTPKPAPQLEAKEPEPARTPEQMIEFLVKGGMPLARAQQVVGGLKKKANMVADDIKAIVDELADDSKEPLN